MKYKNYNFYKFASILLFSIVAYILTAFYNREFLLWAEELSLFIPNKLFFLQSMKIPGGLLGYVGAFFTQFFYYPILGSTILVLLWLFVSFLVSRAFGFSAGYLPIAFLPAIMLLFSVINVEYALFTIKSPGYLFSNTIGIIVCLFGIILYEKIKAWNKRLVVSLLLIALGYPLFGVYALFTVVLFFIYEIIYLLKERLFCRFVTAGLTIVSLVVVPYLYYLYLYSGLQANNIYTSGLPNFNLKSEIYLLIPFIIISISLVTFLTMSFKMCRIRKEARLYSIIPSSFMIVVLIAFLGFFRYNSSFITELKMTRLVNENNWKGVLTEANRTRDSATKLISMYRYLSLYKLGLAGDQMFKVNNVSDVSAATRLDPMMIMHIGAKPIYFQYGKVNFCYRWCMEDMVEYGMNVLGLKYMVKCAIVNKEFALAEKYNSVLAKTLFHDKWARRYQRYINNHSLVLTNAEFEALTPLMAYDNVLDGDGNNLEFYILNSFAYMEGGPPELVELSLQCNLFLKNVDRFWPRFILYARTHKRIPVHYQEAALLYSYLENKIDVSEIKFDNGINDRFNQLIAMSKKYANKPDEYISKTLKPIFGDTFWYYYFFCK